jgi:hypothetical protein
MLSSLGLIHLHRRAYYDGTHATCVWRTFFLFGHVTHFSWFVFCFAMSWMFFYVFTPILISSIV